MTLETPASKAIGTCFTTSLEPSPFESIARDGLKALDGVPKISTAVCRAKQETCLEIALVLHR